MFRPGRHRRRRPGCRVAGQDLGQGRDRAAQRQVQVGGTEGEGGYRRAEFDPAGAQRLDERPLRARGRLGEGYADRDDRLARGCPGQGKDHRHGELEGRAARHGRLGQHAGRSRWK
jgi:hypothetical protein